MKLTEQASLARCEMCGSQGVTPSGGVTQEEPQQAAGLQRGWGFSEKGQVHGVTPNLMTPPGRNKLSCTTQPLPTYSSGLACCSQSHFSWSSAPSSCLLSGIGRETSQLFLQHCCWCCCLFSQLLRKAELRALQQEQPPQCGVQKDFGKGGSILARVVDLPPIQVADPPGLLLTRLWLSMVLLRLALRYRAVPVAGYVSACIKCMTCIKKNICNNNRSYEVCSLWLLLFH